jgi:hypothetical protein
MVLAIKRRVKPDSGTQLLNAATASSTGDPASV